MSAPDPHRECFELITPVGVGQIDAPMTGEVTEEKIARAARMVHLGAVQSGWGDLDEVRVYHAGVFQAPRLAAPDEEQARSDEQLLADFAAAQEAGR